MISEQDRVAIRKIVRSGTHPARVICRAYVLNMSQKGLSPAEIADFLEITPRTVLNIRQNYRSGGLEKALYDDPRPGSPPKFDDRVKSTVVALACSNPPEGFDRWTLDLLASATKSFTDIKSISREKVRVILREHDIKPWFQKMWCVADLNETYIERMEDVLDLYTLDHDAKCPVVCLDEKPIQLHDDVRPSSGLNPGELRKVDYEYKRNGTANVFCAVEPKAGTYHLKVTKTRTAKDFAHFLRDLEKKYSSAEKIRLVMDNLNTHRKKSLIDSFGEESGSALWDRFEVHPTPVHASWLNQAEIAIGMYSRQCLGKTRIPTLDLLELKTERWGQYINKKKVSIKWGFTKEQARKKFRYGRLREKTSEPEH